jgi:hypothetical protein
MFSFRNKVDLLCNFNLVLVLEMLRNLSRLAINVCRQQRIVFEAVRALGTDEKICFSYINSIIFFHLASSPLNMPSLSPTMSEGTIVRWLKKEGLMIN